MQRVLAQARAVLLELQLLAAHLAPQRIVMVAGLLAHEKHGLHFFLTFTLSHGTTLLFLFASRVVPDPGYGFDNKTRSHALRESTIPRRSESPIPRLYGQSPISSRGAYSTSSTPPSLH